MTKQEKRFMLKVKDNAFKLRKNGQLPYSLYIAILNLNYESDINEVKKLSELSEKYIRVGGYYIRHPEAQYECDKELKSM